MKQRPRIYYTESQKALMWERWLPGYLIETTHWYRAFWIRQVD